MASATSATATPIPSDTPTPTDTASPTPTETPTGSAILVIEQLSGLTTPEYVIIRTTGSIPQDMTGWSLFSVVGSQSCSFPAGYVLGAGASVQIESFTGAVDSPPSILLWSGAAIWNNTGDKAELLRPDASVVSSVCYLAGCP